VDAVIAPRQTRPRLIRALRRLGAKRDRNPPKKHGNTPLRAGRAPDSREASAQPPRRPTWARSGAAARGLAEVWVLLYFPAGGDRSGSTIRR
jgi:hypothetical protein